MSSLQMDRLTHIHKDIAESYNMSGGDEDILYLIELARRTKDLDVNQVEYLKLKFASVILKQKQRRGELPM